MGVKPISNPKALGSALSTSQQWLAESDEDALARLQLLVGGFRTAHALYAIAKLGIADLLHAGLQRSDELALATGTHALSLYRLLRLLVSVGVLTEETKDVFALTRVLHKLRSDLPDSLRSFILAELGGARRHTWETITRSMKREQPLRKSASFPYPERESPAFCQRSPYCDQGLGSVAARVHAAVLNTYDFSSAGTLLDVGGGDGTFLAFLLQAHENVQGVLVEQPYVIENARCRLNAEGVSHRCKVVAGDFFEFLPRQADTYVLKWILSHYEDALAVRILANCRRAMPSTGKLLLIDAVALMDKLPSFLKLQVVDGLASAPQRERTVDEFRMLLQRAGLRITRVLPACPEASIIEAVGEKNKAKTGVRC